jgi:hypothetical protein
LLAAVAFAPAKIPGVEEPWTRHESLAAGQVFEFRVWAALTEQSRGQLHVFLPLSDRGIDAMVHRLTDGAYIPVQAKGRSVVLNGEVHLVVRADTIGDDSIMIVSGLIVDGGLGPVTMVVPTADFRRLAKLSTDMGHPIYEMAFPMHLPAASKWKPWLTPPDGIAERFGILPVRAALTRAEDIAPYSTGDRGFLGESEVIRRLAEAEDLNLFRPFPDLETAELVVRHRVSRRVIGLQVKTVTVDAANTQPTVGGLMSSFRPAPTTYFTVLAWLQADARFEEDCLMFPSERLHEFAVEDNGRFTFHFDPGSARLKSYRRPLAELRAAAEDLLVAT